MNKNYQIMQYKNRIFDERLTVFRTNSIVENETTKNATMMFFDEKTKQAYQSDIV